MSCADRSPGLFGKGDCVTIPARNPETGVLKSLAFLATPAVAAPRLRAAQAGAFGAAALAAPLPAQAVEGVSTFEFAFGGICLFFLLVVVVSDYLKVD
ncbi:unnamed protein product [Symbiodinium sp. CCMP2456]|nr:unnamed protein product [Symbiodinium sp. CCMP2456]